MRELRDVIYEQGDRCYGCKAVNGARGYFDGEGVFRPVNRVDEPVLVRHGFLDRNDVTVVRLGLFQISREPAVALCQGCDPDRADSREERRLKVLALDQIYQATRAGRAAEDVPAELERQDTAPAIPVEGSGELESASGSSIDATPELASFEPRLPPLGGKSVYIPDGFPVNWSERMKSEARRRAAAREAGDR